MSVSLVEDPSILNQNKPITIQMVRIIDKMGDVKKSIKGNSSGSMNIPLTELPAGVYTVSVFDGSHWVSKQFIKQ